MSSPNPTVLIATTERWYPAARLAIALAEAGCMVHALCPSGHPLEKTTVVQRIYSFNGLTPLRSFANAIAGSQADLLIPGDDLAARHLLALRTAKLRRNHGAPICALVERSLGAPDMFPFIYARAKFIALAAELGIRVPQTEAIHSTQQLDEWIRRTGVPAVLKANGTSGGDGVKVVHSAEEAHHAFRKLQAPPLFARAVKRALVDQDTTLLLPSLLRRGHTVNAQGFIAGREATSAFACWKGQVLASVHVEVINKMHAAGHATVVRRIENAEMQSAAQKIARRLNLSGLHGLDFMIESQTGNAYLIEMNPRATQIGHLNLGADRNLPAAISAALTGRFMQSDGPVTENELIALFPQECLRDPASPFLKSAYHDVPWSEPALVQHALGKLRAPHVLSSNQNWGRMPLPRSPQKYIAPTLDCKTD